MRARWGYLDQERSVRCAAGFIFLACPRKTEPERRHPLLTPCGHPVLRVRVRRRNFSTVHPCTDEKRCASCAPPCGLIRRRPPLRRGPGAPGIVPFEQSSSVRCAQQCHFKQRASAFAGAAIPQSDHRLLLPVAGTMPAAPGVPCVAVCGGGSARRVADTMSAIVSSAHGCAVETTRRHARTCRTGCPEGATPGRLLSGSVFLRRGRKMNPAAQRTERS